MPNSTSPSDLFHETPDELFLRTKRRGLFKSLYPIPFIVCLLFVFIHVLLLDTSRLNGIENQFLDQYFRQKPAVRFDPSLVFIEIDDESLEAIGAWPWPLRYHAQMIQLLSQWGVRAIVFDSIFSDKEAPEEIALLADAIQASGRVYLPVDFDYRPERKIWVHSLPVVLEARSEKKMWIHSAQELESVAKAIGHRMMEPDPDGILRRVPLILKPDDQEYMQLGFRTGLDQLKEEEQKSLLRGFKAREPLLIPWFRSKGAESSRFSYAELVRSYQALREGRSPVISPELLRGKICLIGVSAKDQAEQKVTPLGSEVPAWKIHAYFIDSVLKRHFIKPVSLKMQPLFLILLGLVASLIFGMTRGIPLLFVSLGLMGFWALLSYAVLIFAGYWFFVFQPILMLISLFIVSLISHLIMATRERRELYALATRDGLTGLYVIRHFREILNTVVKEARRLNQEVAVILMDIDNFKKINDTYGHPCGDKVLKKTAQILYSQLRSKRSLEGIDFIARYGGEEFIVLLRDVKLQAAALTIAERLRQSVEGATYDWEGNPVKVTLSLGVASLRENENIPDPMVRRADQALYEAKRQGKNRVCTSP